MRAFGLPGNRGHKQHLAFMQGHAQASGGRELNVANWARSKQCTDAWMKGYKMAKQSKTLPWDDCKVAFGITKNYAAVEDYFVKCTDNRHFPVGWHLSEKDDAGGRCVVVFRVEGELKKEDGEKVRKFLDNLKLNFL
jgi:hypothetical protein